MIAATTESTGASGRALLRWRVLDASWPAVLWLVLAARFHALQGVSGLRADAVWGVLVLASLVAWGASLARTMAPRQSFGWGFHGAVGMAMTLSFFGALTAVRLVSKPVIVAWCVAGPVAFGVTRWRAGAGRALPAPLRWNNLSEAWAWTRAKLAKPRPIAFYAGVGILVAMAGLQYIGSVMGTSFNAWDDNMAYRAFAREFLDTGTFLDSFSYRRTGAYGGQSLLQAFILAMTNRNRVHIVDDGLCVILGLGLVLGFRARPGWATRAGILAAGLLFMTIPYHPHNVASAYSGVVFFLALYRLFDDPGFERASSRTNVVLAGLLVAAVCTLRQNYIAPAFGFLGLMYLGLVFYPSNRTRLAWAKEGAAAIGMSLVFLAPWMITSYVAIGTPFFPVFRGYLRPDFGITGRATKAEILRWSLENLFFFKPIVTVALFFFAGFALPFNRRNRAIHAFLFCCVGSFAMMMWFFQTFDQADSIARYYFAFSIPFCAAATLRAVADTASAKRVGEAFVGGAMVTMAVGLQFVDARDTVKGQYSERITALETFWHASGPDEAWSPQDDLYQRLQNAVPPKAKLLVALDHTYLLDGKRNPILHYDHPGAMGPKGGPPVGQGAAAFASWMHANGIRYIAVQLGPTSAEYNRPLWDGRLKEPDPKNGRGGFYKRQAAFELDFFAVFEELERSHATIFREGDVRVLDLESPR
jgi:hypothetical protein